MVSDLVVDNAREITQTTRDGWQTFVSAGSWASPLPKLYESDKRWSAEVERRFCQWVEFISEQGE